MTEGRLERTIDTLREKADTDPVGDG